MSRAPRRRSAALPPTAACLALAALLLPLGACGDDSGDDDTTPAVDAAAPGPDAAPGVDGSPPACDLPAPGARCLDAYTLEHCNGTQVEQVDCFADGRLCGSDPERAGSVACIGEGDDCGRIDFLGECAGEVLAWCEESGLVVADCESVYSRCELVDSDIGYYCTNGCTDADVPTTGDCSADTLRQCLFADGAFSVVETECPAGTTCDVAWETGWPGCVPSGGDCEGDVGPQGGCKGDSLTRCVGGSPQTTNCADGDQVCAYGGDALGYLCADAGASGAFAVSGTVRYEDRPARVGRPAELSPLPVRGATIAVVADDGGDVLASAATADDGSYVLRYDAAAGASVHVLVATASGAIARPVRVIRPDGRVHGFGGASFTAAASVSQDILVTDASGEAPAFNIFDQLLTGIDFARGVYGEPAPTPVYVSWQRGVEDPTAFYPDLVGIFITSNADDEDGYDDPVIRHELGHYIEHTFGRSDNPGLDHFVGEPSDPNEAWSEGFATYFSGASGHDPLYVDTNAFGGFGFDMDDQVTHADPGMPVTQDLIEDLVSEALWDVADGQGGGDDDDAAAGDAAVLQVTADYFRGGDFADRGEPGVDLVDWLDGWFLGDGLGSCAAVRDIVTGARDFPYDYAGPAGACP